MIKFSFVTILLVVCCFELTNGQSIPNPYPPKLDSLQKLLAIQPQADTVRVIRLNQVAQLCFFDMQFERGLKATKQARVLAKKIGYTKGEGLYLQSLEFLAEYSAIAYYYDAEAVWFFADRNEKRPEIFFPFSEKIDFERKNNLLKAFLKTLNEKDDAEIIGIVLRVICANYRELEQFNESLSYLDRSVNMFLNANLLFPAYYMLAFEFGALLENGKLKEADAVEKRLLKFLAKREATKETSLIANEIAYIYERNNKPTQAYALLIKADSFLEQIGEEQIRPQILYRLGLIYNMLELPGKALVFFEKIVAIHEKQQNIERLPEAYHNIAFTLILLKRFREAQIYVDKARKLISNQPDTRIKKIFLARNNDAAGQILMGEKKYLKALSIFTTAIELAIEAENEGIIFYLHLYIAQCYQQLGNINESNRYGLISYEQATQARGLNGRETLFRCSRLLYENYETLNQPLQAYKYLKANDALKKTIDADNTANRLADIEINTITQKSELEKSRLEKARLLKEQENQNQRWWLFSVAAGLFSAVVLLVIVYRNNRHKQKANALLHRQKEEIDYQRAKAEDALTDLKVTQTQLIQKEKLASLGELTAGIAHEIQNPLNFVNNFSEVSVELVDEFREGPFQKLPDSEKEYAEEILVDLTGNLQKIRQHGGRASNIVKGMLEHSRTDSGEKRPTNLNTLAEEYLKIAYQGILSKDKTDSPHRFSCELVMNFDPTMEPVEASPQEIGRVLLNLYNNALYAVKEQGALGKGQGVDYQPTVWVSTKRFDKHVEIRVRDNGTGIPESVKAKIFQPFFTTKPTGEGTGLGLSLSYDIITKGHGGSLTAESMEGAGTEFIITLPVG